VASDIRYVLARPSIVKQKIETTSYSHGDGPEEKSKAWTEDYA
jgi:hypothetical protein